MARTVPPDPEHQAEETDVQVVAHGLLNVAGLILDGALRQALNIANRDDFERLKLIAGFLEGAANSDSIDEKYRALHKAHLLLREMGLALIKDPRGKRASAKPNPDPSGY